MTWGDAKTYAWLYSQSLTVEYRRKLLRWLEAENPELCKLVRKELARMKVKEVTLDEWFSSAPFGPAGPRVSSGPGSGGNGGR